MASGFGLVLLGLLAWGIAEDSAGAELPFTLALLVLMIGAPALGGLYIKARRTDYAISALVASPWLHWEPEPGQREVWFGPDGLLYGDQYLPWVASGNYLVKASADLTRPACLLLTFEKFNGQGSGRNTIKLRIPDARAADLEVLAGRLRARCPTARIT